MSEVLTCTKCYRDFSFAHRQENHDGHCKYVHLHGAWGFDICFRCDTLDDNGFVFDFGRLKEIKKQLDYYFDHTFCVSETDPEKNFFLEMERRGLCQLRIIPEKYGVSAEGLAVFVYDLVSRFLIPFSNGPRNVEVHSVTCWEDSKNYATYASN